MDDGNEGILVVDKAAGPTSHDVVAMARRTLQVRRIGHCGTLDPLATGVLVLCVGPLTRLCDWIGRGQKEYVATVRLGATSSTDDAQGEIAPGGAALPTAARIEAALAAFRGRIEQVPPAHSAVKVDGVRSYRRARRNEVVELAPRTVHVERFDLLDWSPPCLRVRVVCGRGTYIRSLARDLGAALGCGGYVEALRRERIGSLRAADGVPLEDLRAGDDVAGLRAAFVEPRAALDGILPAVDLDVEAGRSFSHGQAVAAGAGLDGEGAVFAEDRFLGIGVAEAGGLMRPLRVFAGAAALV